MAKAAGAGSRGRAWLPAIALIAAAAVTALGAAAASGGVDGPLVRIATTGHGSERVDTLPITPRPGAGKRVVISFGPNKLPELAPGDRVRVTAEMQVTGNCGHREPRCRGPIYHYAPDVRASLIVAPDERTTGGPGTVAISAMKRDECTQRRPDYEHHCVLTFTRAGFVVSGPEAPPCAPVDCHINLVAGASHPAAEEGELITVGGLRPDGSIPQDRGRINVVRYRGTSAPQFATTSTTTPRRRSLPPDFKRRVVFSHRLDGLARDEQLSVVAKMATDVSHLRYAVRTSARLILAETPTATRGGPFVKAGASLGGEISENNGSNCTQDEGTCISRKVGVLEMRRDAVSPSGRPIPLYVNLITVLGPKVKKARGDDRVIIRRGGIEVTRFPPEVNG